MTTHYKQAKKARKLKRRQEARQLARDNAGWCKLTMLAACGCCQVHLWYKTRLRAEQVALLAQDCASQTVTLTDDKGHSHVVLLKQGIALSAAG